MTKRDRQAAEYALEQPRNGALSGCDPVRRELTLKERVALERTIAFIEGNGWICDTLRGLLAERGGGR